MRRDLLQKGIDQELQIRGDGLAQLEVRGRHDDGLNARQQDLGCKKGCGLNLNFELIRTYMNLRIFKSC